MKKIVAVVFLLSGIILTFQNRSTYSEGEKKKLPKFVTPKTARAIKNGLKYLGSAQRKDGSYASSRYGGGYPVAISSLCGLAFLAQGNTPTRGKYAKNVRKILSYLLKHQRSSGLITSSYESRCMYGHGFAMLFLAQAYGMGADKETQKRIHKALKKGIKLSQGAQTKEGGWGYEANSSYDEGSVSVTQIQALRACRNIGLHVPKSVIDKSYKYLKVCQNSDGGIAYSANSRGSSRPSISAAACCSLYYAGKYDSPIAKKLLKYLKGRIGSGGRYRGGYGYYYYTNFYLAQVMWQASAKEPKIWKKYFPGVRDYLLNNIRSNSSWMGDHIGTSYGTALAILILSIPYKLLPIFQK